MMVVTLILLLVMSWTPNTMVVAFGVAATRPLSSSTTPTLGRLHPVSTTTFSSTSTVLWQKEPSSSRRQASSNSDHDNTGSLQENPTETVEPAAQFDPLWMEERSQAVESQQRRNTGLLGALGVASWQLYRITLYTPAGFVRLPTTQYIAALGSPTASSGTNAHDWGYWRQDPGPRGVYLKNFDQQLVQRDFVAPIGNWQYNPHDWWIEEHGLIMESPTFPIPAGRYLVTGGREVMTGLTVRLDGTWSLDEGAVLGDVTHLPCRSARYQPILSSSSSETAAVATPQQANVADFPVRPGAPMPAIAGTTKQDYAVLFLIGKAA